MEGRVARRGYVKDPRHSPRPLQARGHTEDLDRLRQLDSAPALGTAVCARCANRFTQPEGKTHRFCSRVCELTPAPSNTRTIICDGQEYLATSIGKSSLTDWPAGTGGSTLDGGAVHLPGRHR